MRTRHLTRWTKQILLAALLLTNVQTFAWQEGSKSIALARQYMQNKEYDKALPVFKEIYDQAPFDKAIYDEYLDAIMLAGQYSYAEELVTYMSKIRRDDPAMLVDMGKVFEAAGKKKAAREQYDMAIAKISGEDFRTRLLADAFSKINNTDYAIKAYERARVMVQNPYLYATELALLYGKTGNTEQAVNAMLDVVLTQPNTMDDIKSSLLQIIDTDDKKKSITQKQISKRIALQLDNPYWVELLTWMYVQNGDYEGGYQQTVALDKKLKEEGERVVSFSKTAAKDGQYAIALKGYKYVMDKGSSAPMYEQAWDGKIEVMLRQLEEKRPVDPEMLAALLKEYKTFLNDYPQYNISSLLKSYAMV
ncbi:MAG: hypothetical protein EOP49_07750, partial [Sphingobacteriales bacterium]